MRKSGSTSRWRTLQLSALPFSKFLPLSLVFCLLACEQSDRPALYMEPEPEEVAVEFAMLDVAALQAGYDSAAFTVVDVVTALLERADRLEPALNAVIASDPTALAQSRRLDSLASLGERGGRLHGVPVYLKDNIELAGELPTTAGARVLSDSRPNRDAALVARLREAGAVILGKANLSEWANFHSSFSSSGYSGVGGQTRNPYDTTRSPCGSSAGSAVVVAARYAPLAIGTETNGSIVCPSHANGIVGIKPTVGLVSRRGVVPISETQDTPGPMARTVADAARALTALQGVDSADARTLAAAEYATRDYTASLRTREGLVGKRIGLYAAPLGEHFRVDTLVARTVRRLEAAGATVVRVDELVRRDPGRASYEVLLYEFKDGLGAYLRTLPDTTLNSLADVIARVDTSAADMARFDHGILRAADAKGGLSEWAYRRAKRDAARAYGRDGIDRVVRAYDLDCLMAPTGGPAWKIDLVNGDNFALGSSTPAAVAGYPNLTVPMGQIDGLPVGVSFFGPAWSEPVLIEVGSAWEALRGELPGPGGM